MIHSDLILWTGHQCAKATDWTLIESVQSQCDEVTQVVPGPLSLDEQFWQRLPNAARPMRPRWEGAAHARPLRFLSISELTHVVLPVDRLVSVKPDISLAIEALTVADALMWLIRPDRPSFSYGLMLQLIEQLVYANRDYRELPMVFMLNSWSNRGEPLCLDEKQRSMLRWPICAYVNTWSVEERGFTDAIDQAVDLIGIAQRMKRSSMRQQLSEDVSTSGTHVAVMVKEQQREVIAKGFCRLFSKTQCDTSGTIPSQWQVRRIGWPGTRIVLHGERPRSEHAPLSTVQHDNVSRYIRLLKGAIGIVLVCTADDQAIDEISETTRSRILLQDFLELGVDPRTVPVVYLFIDSSNSHSQDENRRDDIVVPYWPRSSYLHTKSNSLEPAITMALDELAALVADKNRGTRDWRRTPAVMLR